MAMPKILLIFFVSYSSIIFAAAGQIDVAFGKCKKETEAPNPAKWYKAHLSSGDLKRGERLKLIQHPFKVGEKKEGCDTCMGPVELFSPCQPCVQKALDFYNCKSIVMAVHRSEIAENSIRGTTGRTVEFMATFGESAQDEACRIIGIDSSQPTSCKIILTDRVAFVAMLGK